MNKNTRWALAIVGVVIIIVGAIVIGTGKDKTDAIQTPAAPATEQTGPTAVTPATAQTGTTGATEKSSKSGSGDSSSSGGASPGETKDDSGGASPVPGAPRNTTTGAEAEVDTLSPILSDEKQVTVTTDVGDTVMIRGLSESDGEMHIHGYDKEVPMKAGRIARAKFKANIDGEFAIEFHLPGGEVKVGTLRVNP